MPSKSYKCAGCTNVMYMVYNGEDVGKYCKPVYEGTHRVKWEGEFLRCLNYTTDPKKEDRIVRLWMPPKERKSNEKQNHRSE